MLSAEACVIRLLSDNSQTLNMSDGNDKLQNQTAIGQATHDESVKQTYNPLESAAVTAPTYLANPSFYFLQVTGLAPYTALTCALCCVSVYAELGLLLFFFYAARRRVKYTFGRVRDIVGTFTPSVCCFATV